MRLGFESIGDMSVRDVVTTVLRDGGEVGVGGVEGVAGIAEVAGGGIV